MQGHSTDLPRRIGALARTGFVVVLLLCALGFALPAEGGISVSSRSFAAIAYSPATGKIGMAYNLRSRKSAEAAAVKDCDAADARVVAWVNRGFCALALGDDKSCWGIGYDYGDGASTEKALATALDHCKQRTTGAHIVAATSSDGQYTWPPTCGDLRRDADGTVTLPSGIVLKPNGDVIFSSGEVVHPGAGQQDDSLIKRGPNGRIITPQGTVDEQGNVAVPGLGGMTFAPNGDILGADGQKLYDGEKKAWAPGSGINRVPAGTSSPSPSATEEPKRAKPTPPAANEIEFNPEPHAIITPRPKPTP